MNRHHWWIVVLLAVVLWPMSPVRSAPPAEKEAAAPSEDIEIMRLSHRLAGEIVEIVRSALTPGGRVSVDVVSNALVVIDDRENLSRVKEMVLRLDQPVAQVTIILRWQEDGEGSGSLSTRRGVSGTEGRRLGTAERQRLREMRLRLSSGTTGYLRLATAVPVDQYWLEICGRYGHRFSWISTYREVETGFEVRPLVVGDQVDISLAPRLSFDAEHQLSFSSAATRMTVPVGQWVPVVGIADADRQLYSTFFGGARQAATTTVLSVLVMVSGR